MTGTSYNGTLPLAAATTGVQGLEAIIPIAPNTSYYHYYRSNGLVRHPGGYMGEDIDVLYNFIHSGNEEKRDHCDCEVRDKEMANGQDRVTGDYNAFWAGRDYLNQMGPMHAALLMSHGFNDWNVVPEHSVRIYEAAKAKGLPVQFFCHQGGHGGAPPMSMMNRWFTKYLHGVDNGVEKGPRSWIVRETAKQSEPSSYPDYPHPDAQWVTLYPTKGGNALGGLSTDLSPDQKPELLVDDASIKGKVLAQAESSKNRLLFVTPELKEPLHISGYSKMKIRLASSKPAANLTVWLVSLPWTEDPKGKITDNLITRGWADPQNHRSLTESEPLVPNKFYDLSFSLQPDDQIIAAGEKVGLMIFSSDPEFTLLPEAGTELTVDLQETRLDLPVVGGQAAYQKAVAK
jgi:X-Pro dipeptidyl-peptidase